MRRGAGGRQPGGAKNGEEPVNEPSSFRVGERERGPGEVMVVIVSDVREKQNRSKWRRNDIINSCKEADLDEEDTKTVRKYDMI